MKTIAITFATASLLFCALAPEIAGANTIENFSFTQAGYAGTEMATGTFTGIPELHGSIQLADLTAFSISYMALIGRPNVTETDTYTLPDLKLFSFRPAADGPNSSLDLFASITTGTPGSICVGAGAAFGCAARAATSQAKITCSIRRILFCSQPQRSLQS